MLRAIIVALLFLAPAVPALAAESSAAPDAAAVPPASAATLRAVVAPAADDAAARATVRALAAATTVNDANGNKVFDTLEAFAVAGAPLSVLVTGRAGTDPVALVAGAERTLGRALDVKRVTHLVPTVATTLTLAEAVQVAALRDVRQVEPNTVGYPELAEAAVAMGARAVQNELGVTGDLDGLPAFTAADVTIAVLDTGFDGDHVDLKEGKLVRFVDMDSGKEKDPYDTGDHGTHVASIAAGLGRGDPELAGVAPGAGVLGLKISVEENGGSTVDNAIAAVAYAVAHKDELNVRVLTISFGFGVASDGTSALELAMDEAWDAGIVNFKSTGNSGPGRTTVTVPGAARGIIATGAMLVSETGGSVMGQDLGPAAPVDKLMGFQLASFSSRGPTTDGRIKPDLVAPGYSINAAQAGTTDGYSKKSGTSMASPFAAGAAALVIAADPTLTPDATRDILRGTAEDWGLAGPDIDYGWGRIDVLAAVATALTGGGARVPDATPPFIARHETHAGRFGGNGLATATVTVEEADEPIALTVIGESGVLAVTIQDPSGNVVLASGIDGVNTGPARQAERGFLAPAAGDYLVTLQGVPNAAWTMDAAHGATLAPSLLDIVAGLTELEGASDGAPTLSIPDTGALALIVCACAAALRTRRL